MNYIILALMLVGFIVFLFNLFSDLSLDLRKFLASAPKDPRVKAAFKRHKSRRKQRQFNSAKLEFEEDNSELESEKSNRKKR